MGNPDVLAVIRQNPGLRLSQLADKIALPLRQLEGEIWDLWSSGEIQIEPDSTMRVTRSGEKVFRHFAP
jgi:hypothetical protein